MRCKQNGWDACGRRFRSVKRVANIYHEIFHKALEMSRQQHDGSSIDSIGGWASSRWRHSALWAEAQQLLHLGEPSLP